MSKRRKRNHNQDGIRGYSRPKLGKFQTEMLWTKLKHRICDNCEEEICDEAKQDMIRTYRQSVRTTAVSHGIYADSKNKRIARNESVPKDLEANTH